MNRGGMMLKPSAAPPSNLACTVSAMVSGGPHAHRNAGLVQARFLIVQDGGLHHRARTMGFEFLETAPG